MMRTALFGTLAGAALAITDYTPIPVEWPGTCTEYPAWQNVRGSDLTGAWMITVAEASDSTFNNLPLQEYTIPWGSGTRDYLGVDFVATTSVAKAYYRCFNGVPYIGGGSTNNVTIAKDMNNANLLVNAAGGAAYVPEIYYLQGPDGKRLDGVYLGARNQTKWGFFFQRPSCSADGKATWPFLETKLLGLPVDDANPPTAGNPATYQGYLKLVAW